MKQIKIRMATLKDSESILNIYKPYVLNSSATFEYDVPTIDEFENRIVNTLKVYPYLVAEIDDKIVGYAYAGVFKGRIAYQYACEVSIYISEHLQHKGVGKRLYEVLESILKRQGIYNLNACITYPNDKSINFHKKLGYELVAHFHKCGYKFNKWYDMVWMEKIINDHSVTPKPLKSIDEIHYLDLLEGGII